MLAQPRWLLSSEPSSPPAVATLLPSACNPGATVSAILDAVLPPEPAEQHDALPLEVDMTSDDPAIRGLSWDLVLGQQKTIERLQDEAARDAAHQRAIEKERQADELEQRRHDRALELAAAQREADEHHKDREHTRALELARTQGEELRRSKAREQFGWLLLAVSLIAFTGAGVRFRGQWLGLEVTGADAQPTPTVDARPQRQDEETEP